MAVYVKKFGGSSLANLDRISHVADIIAENHKARHSQVIVVSAMFGETDRLIDFISGFNYKFNSREYAVLVATGEQVAMSLLCMALTDRGLPAKSFNSSQARIYTDSNYTRANIIDVDCKNLKQCIADNNIAVVAGFQGVDTNGDITTLGRGGSDTTAVALSAVLQAKECLIYTDVDGVYTADPKIVPNAHKISSISHSEMLVLSHLGAKVMQPRSVELASKYNMTIKVLSSFHTEGGTSIEEPDCFPMESPVVKAIACLNNMVKISLTLSAEYSSKLSELLHICYENGLKLEMLRLSGSNPASTNLHLDCVIGEQELDTFNEIIENNINKNIIISSNFLHNKSVLSAVGLGLRGHNYSNILSKLLSALEKENIEVFSMCTGDIRVSLLIKDSDSDLALRVSHKVLELDQLT